MAASDEEPDEEDGFQEITSPTQGGEETESSDEEDDEEATLGRRFGDILAMIKNTDIKDVGHELRDFARVEAFAEQSPWLAEKTTGDGEHNTLLHLLVEEARDKVFEKYETLISVLLLKFPKLLREKDSNEKTPLYIAISKKREKVVRLMCTTEKDIDSVFKIVCYQSNCLHQAVKRSVAPHLLIYLINLSSPSTLCAQDGGGHTPLHLAVDYERCIESQLEVVRAFVMRCDDAMDMRTNAPHFFSPYRWHEYSRNLAIKAAEAEAAANKDLKEKELAKEKDTAKYDDLKPKTPLSNLGSKFMKNPKLSAGPKGGVPSGGAAAREIEAEHNRINKEFVIRRSNTGSRALTQQPALAVPSGATRTTSNDGRSSTGAKKKSRTRTREEIKVTEEAADDIKNFLKLHCLRSRNDDAAVDFLYGKTQENQIYFDLYETPSDTISEERIETGLAHLKFEDTLQYIAFPARHVERIPTKLAKRQQQDGRGRRDMEFLFDFLREKKVKRVLKVIVDDTADPPHSDESIERCVGGLGCEVWDWKKVDLCTLTLALAAPDVRELSLYWSGNNAILRGWSEPDGLAQLARLEVVHLNFSQGLESVQRTRLNIREFCKRLKTLRPDIKVDVVKENQTSRHDQVAGTLDPATLQTLPGHQWLSCMDEFADFIQNIIPSSPIQEPIVVALIDDGVDVNEQSLGTRIIGGRSFCMRNRFENLSMPYYVTSGGHGTVMASLICRVCPLAQLYVLKLDEYMSDSQKRQITAKSAEKAVRAAISKGVHIINMSWTIEMTADNTADVAGLESAIEDAAKAGILMFCSANDQGIARDRSFPSASSTKHIFKIGAAEASGVIWKWAGDPNDVDWIFPGHNVVKDRPNDMPLDKCKTLTGSSVATAVATGLAALILYCIQLGALHTQALKLGGTATTMKDFEAVKRHERMKEAFLAIGTSNKYVEVWDFFGQAVKKAESASREGKMSIVADLSQRLKTTKKYN